MPGIGRWVDLVAFVSRLFDLRILASGRSRFLSWHRCLFATFASSWLGHPVKEVAAALGKAPGSVSRWLGEGLELQLSEPDFRSRLERLLEVLAPVDGVR